MIWNVAYVVGSAMGSGGAARPGAEDIVSRPRLVGRLGASAQVTVVSAPPGSGKTVLLRSWISQAGAASCAAWVPVGRAEHDPRQSWLSVLAALRHTDPEAVLVQPLPAVPDLDGWAIAERPLTDLALLNNRVWLVLNDVHELGPDALRKLELLIMRAPPGLRFVLATRHDGAGAAPCCPASRRTSALPLAFSRPRRLGRAECQHPSGTPREASALRKPTRSNQPRTQASYRPTLLRRARSWPRFAAPQPMRLGSKNGHATGDDDLRVPGEGEKDDRRIDRVLSGFGS